MAFAKRSKQEKATPMMAVRASHGLHTPPGLKSRIVRNSLRSVSGCFFIRFRHWRRGAINGDLRQPQRPIQWPRQRLLRGQRQRLSAES